MALTYLLYTIFLTTSFPTTSLNLFKSTATGFNLSTSYLYILLFKLFRLLGTFSNLSISDFNSAKSSSFSKLWCVNSYCIFLSQIFFHEGGSPLSDWKSRDCKIRSLSMPSTSYCTRPHVFTSFARLKKKLNWLEFFFPSLANDNVKVNKTQRISAEISNKNLW